MDIIRAFGISKTSIKRAVKLYREVGPKRFYAKRYTRGAAVLTPPGLEQAQQIKYHPHSGWFEVAPLGGAFGNEGPTGAVNPHQFFMFR